MPINKESFDYIKSTFTTQQQINDYIKEIDYLKTNAATDNPVTGAPAYGALVSLFTKSGAEVNAEGGSQTYLNAKLPSAKKIILPNRTDELWVSTKKILIKKSVLAFDYSIDNVTDTNIREYLKKYFDNSLPDPKSNISIDDPIFDNAWKKYYENINSIYSIFGSPYNGAQLVVLAYADAIISRLKEFDISAEKPPEKPFDWYANQPAETPQYTDVMPEAERLEALSMFLQNAGMNGPAGDSTATLFANILERNFINNRSEYLDQTRRFLQTSCFCTSSRL